MTQVGLKGAFTGPTCKSIGLKTPCMLSTAAVSAGLDKCRKAKVREVVLTVPQASHHLAALILTSLPARFMRTELSIRLEIGPDMGPDEWLLEGF